MKDTFLIEVTETEPIEEIEYLAASFIAIMDEIDMIKSGHYDWSNNPLKNAPHTLFDLT